MSNPSYSHNTQTDIALISWEEAEWTRQALGMSVPEFARTLDVHTSLIYQRIKKPQGFLNQRSAVLLTLAVNRIKPVSKGNMGSLYALHH